MKPGETIGTTKWCHLRYNEALRTAVRLRVKNYNTAEICRQVRLHPKNFYKWMSGANPKAVSQWKLVSFCKKMNIKLSLKIEIED